MRRSAVSFMQFGVGLFPWMNVLNSNFRLFLHVVNGARYQSSTTFSKIFLTTAISINKHMGYSYHYNFSILRYACFKGTHQNDFYDFSSFFFFACQDFLNVVGPLTFKIDITCLILYYLHMGSLVFVLIERTAT